MSPIGDSCSWEIGSRQSFKRSQKAGGLFPGGEAAPGREAAC